MKLNLHRYRTVATRLVKNGKWSKESFYLVLNKPEYNKLTHQVASRICWIYFMHHTGNLTDPV